MFQRIPATTMRSGIRPTPPNYALENGRADKLRAIGKRSWRRAAQRER